MFKVRRISTGEIVTVYAVSDHQFLIYKYKHPISPRWGWVNMSGFEPVEVADE